MLSSLVVSISHLAEYPDIRDEGLRLHTSHRKEVGEGPKLLVTPPLGCTALPLNVVSKVKAADLSLNLSVSLYSYQFFSKTIYIFLLFYIIFVVILN